MKNILVHLKINNRFSKIYQAYGINSRRYPLRNILLGKRDRDKISIVVIAMNLQLDEQSIFRLNTMKAKLFQRIIRKQGLAGEL